jgi:multidrug efflux system outer membrane protein
LRWWTLYADAQLNLLVDEALTHNNDLLVAAARVEESRALLGVTRADQLPGVTAGAAASRNRISQRTATAFPGIPTEYDDYSVTLNASWEIDFWGKYRRATEAARAQLLASESARDALELSLAADVTRGYFNLRAFDAQVEITRQRLEIRKKALALEQLRFDAGEESELALRQVEAETMAAQALLPSLEQLRSEQESALEVLLGRNPRALLEAGVERGSELDALALPPAIPAGLPSDLLERRPDLREAGQHLVASNALIGVARAAYYPSISLTGAFGFESQSLSNLFSPSAQIWQFAAGRTHSSLRSSSRSAARR